MIPADEPLQSEVAFWGGCRGSHNPWVVGSSPTRPTRVTAGQLAISAFSRSADSLLWHELSTLPLWLGPDHWPEMREHEGVPRHW